MAVLLPSSPSTQTQLVALMSIIRDKLCLFGAIKMAQWMEVFAAQTWQLEFNPWNPCQSRRSDSTDLFSNLHAHTVAYVPLPPIHSNIYNFFIFKNVLFFFELYITRIT